jgi:hypothetical protein
LIKLSFKGIDRQFKLDRMLEAEVFCCGMARCILMVCKNSMLIYKRALMIICCSFLWGCTEKSVSINTVSYSAAQVKTLRLLPDYQAATSFFAKGDKEGAKRLLEALLHRTGLSAVEREYLIGQVALCDKTQPPASPATALGKMPSLSSSRSGA